MPRPTRRAFLRAAGLLLGAPALSCALPPAVEIDGGADGGTEADAGTTLDAGNVARIPAWLQGAPLNEWRSIPGTTGAGLAAVDAFSGFTIRHDTSELFCLCCGGHSDSSDNSVTSINLMDDAPSWIQRHAPSPLASRVQDQPYNTDGLPSSRHTYRHNFWMPELNRLLLVGLRGTWPNAHHHFTVDGFDPDTNTWDAAGTWPTVPAGGGFGQVRDGRGRIWTQGFHRFDPVTRAWSNPGVTGASATSFRTPAVFDSARDQLFCMQWQDGFSSGVAQVNASRVLTTGTTREAVTFGAASGAAIAQFQADKPGRAGMDFDPIIDKFLFYDGSAAGTAGRMFWITPNAGTTWEIELATFGTGSAVLPATGSGGLNSKFAYVPALKGFVLMPTSGTGLFFLRTS